MSLARNAILGPRFCVGVGVNNPDRSVTGGIYILYIYIIYVIRRKLRIYGRGLNMFLICGSLEFIIESREERGQSESRLGSAET